MHVECDKCLFALDYEQKKSYYEDGYLLIENHIKLHEITYLKKEISKLMTLDLPGTVQEQSNYLIRSINGPHLYNLELSRLARLPRILRPVIQLLGSDVYVHQYKINIKGAFEGDIWEWHQDYIFWLKEDGMPFPNAMSVVIYLDEVTEFNAPIFFIPGSHKNGTIDVVANDNIDIPKDAPSWLSNTTSKLKYGADKEVIKKLVFENGLFSAKGSAGTVLFFDCNVFHASSVNISPFDRATIIISYNRVDNFLKSVQNPRPDFLASRDYSPLKPLTEDDFARENRTPC